MVRGEIFRLPAPRGARGHEQRGARYAVVVQADEFLDLSTTLVAPASTSAMPASFRPPIRLRDEDTRVIVERTTRH
jgi:mRNA interferase MazF